MERKPEYLEDWWEIIGAFEKVMWIIATLSALIFMFQVFLFFNNFLKKGGKRGEMEMEYYDFADSLLAFPNIIVFLTFFSWGTLSFFNDGSGMLLSLVYGALVGLVLFFLFAYFYYYFNNKGR